MNERKTVTVTRNCIVREGASCVVQNTGNGFWLILKVDGVKVPSNWTVFLVEGRDFNDNAPGLSVGDAAVWRDCHGNSRSVTVTRLHDTTAQVAWKTGPHTTDSTWVPKTSLTKFPAGVKFLAL